MSYPKHFAALPQTKYKYPKVPDKKYPGGIVLRQSEDAVFVLAGLTQSQARKNRDYLKRQLEKNSPVDTGKLKRSWFVFALEIGRGWGWSLTMYNKAHSPRSGAYFVFPFWHYRKRGQDFVEQSVDAVIKKLKPSGEVPITKPVSKPKPTPKPVVKPKPVNKPKPRKEIVDTSKKVKKEKVDINAIKSERASALLLDDTNMFDGFLNSEPMSFKTWKSKLSKSEITAMRYYKGSAHEALNAGLRENVITSKNAKVVKNLDAAISKEMPRDVIAYRGFDDPKIKRLLKTNKPESLVGESFSDPAYVSASTSIEVAKDFALNSDSPMLAEIRLKKGQKVAVMEDIESGNNFKIDPDTEQELLLPRNTRFKIIEAEYVNINSTKTLKVAVEIE